jgi:hypothetical protein
MRKFFSNNNWQLLLWFLLGYVAGMGVVFIVVNLMIGIFLVVLAILGLIVWAAMQDDVPAPWDQ